ncbi:MAG: asparagine synthetase B [Salinivirgaceae bacterium]
MSKTIKLLVILLALTLALPQGLKAAYLIVPMDEAQKNHLKAYGITYWTLQNDVSSWWLLNYRGGSFLFAHHKEIENECIIRGVSYDIISDAKRNAIVNEISRPDVNMDVVKLDKAPEIAVYSPKDKLPWDDAVTLALTYAEIPYDIIYDREVLDGKLTDYDWLHMHHEDFTGQYGKFYAAYNHTAWYRNQVRSEEEKARSMGFEKVSQMKLAVVQTIKTYVNSGGFLFSMCSGTDSFDIALAAHNTDICAAQFDGDPMDPDFPRKLDYSNTLAFFDFTLVQNPYEYEFSNIDRTQHRNVSQDKDYFTLFDFSAKWDPVPTMLCQNHTDIVKGFMGQTTSYKRELIKPDVLVLGENKTLKEARYIHGTQGKGFWTFYGGHDPEDYRHFVGDPPTDLNLHPNSPGYRLILNNVLFPAAKKKKLKT